MNEINLTQEDANALIALPKVKKDDTQWQVPFAGGNISIPLLSSDKREAFLLDLHRGHIDLLKGTCQNRARQNVVLIRLDFGGAPHRNPDDVEVPCPHLHVYRDGYGAKWAIPAPSLSFTDTTDLWTTLQDFMKYCNIQDPPVFEKELFQ